jgi:hypothetical protein
MGGKFEKHFSTAGCQTGRWKTGSRNNRKRPDNHCRPENKKGAILIAPYIFQFQSMQ